MVTLDHSGRWRALRIAIVYLSGFIGRRRGRLWWMMRMMQRNSGDVKVMVKNMVENKAYGGRAPCVSRSEHCWYFGLHKKYYISKFTAAIMSPRIKALVIMPMAGGAGLAYNMKELDF